MALHETEKESGGVLLDYTNDTEFMVDTSYVSLTAPRVVRCEIAVDGKPHDVVFAGAGGSHSWWTSAGGKFLPPQGLRPGQRLLVTVDGPAALRVDWC